MNAKKIMAFLLTLTMLLGMTACGGGSEQGSTGNSGNSGNAAEAPKAE